MLDMFFLHRKVWRAIAAASGLLALSTVAWANGVPAHWQKTMTNDPATNYFLARVTKPLQDQDAELVRTVLVSLIAIQYCKDVAVNDDVAGGFLRDSGYYKLGGERWADAQFKARTSLGFPMQREVFHLCAGLDYLFGDRGALAPRLVQFRSSEPKLRDVDLHYIILPELPGPKRR